MILGIIAKFLGGEEQNQAEKLTATSKNMGVHVIEGKVQKYLAFLSALHFMKTDLDKREYGGGERRSHSTTTEI